jgi:hypothetical protein
MSNTQMNQLSLVDLEKLYNDEMSTIDRLLTWQQLEYVEKRIKFLKTKNVPCK